MSAWPGSRDEDEVDAARTSKSVPLWPKSEDDSLSEPALAMEVIMDMSTSTSLSSPPPTRSAAVDRRLPLTFPLLLLLLLLLSLLLLLTRPIPTLMA